MELPEFIALMKPLEHATGKQFTLDQAKTYFAVLSDLSVEALGTAVARCLCEWKFNSLPMPGVLRDLATEASHGRLPEWADQWAVVTKAIRCRGGRYARNEILGSLEPITRTAVEAVGFLAICDSEEIGIQAGQFRKAYESLAERETQLRKLPVNLRPGIAEATRTQLTVSTSEDLRLRIAVADQGK